MMRHILLNPTWRCQNNCSYCWVERTVRRRPIQIGAEERPLEDWERAVKRLPSEGVAIDIAGGEPLLLGWVPELIERCKEHQFAVNTNALDAVGVADLTKRRLPNLAVMSLSFHPESGLNKARLKRWMFLADRLSEVYPMSVNVVDYGDNVAKAKKVIEWLREPWRSARVIVSPYEDMDTLGVRAVPGLLCDGGTNHLVVAPDGMAWPCLTALRSPWWAETCLGNWLDGTVDLGRKAQPCYLNCIDYHVLRTQHFAGDIWEVNARLAEVGNA